MAILFVIAFSLAYRRTLYLGVYWLHGGARHSTSQSKHYADKAQAKREVATGADRLPSWLGNRDKVEEFILGIENLAARRGVPVLFSATVLQDPRLQKEMMQYVGAIEAQGASFVGQQMAAAEKLIELHEASGGKHDLA